MIRAGDVPGARGIKSLDRCCQHEFPPKYGATREQGGGVEKKRSDGEERGRRAEAE